MQFQVSYNMLYNKLYNKSKAYTQNKSTAPERIAVTLV